MKSIFFFFFLPTDGDIAVVGILRRRAGFEVGDVEVGERVVDEAVHGPRLAVHVLVDEARDEVRREGYYKGLRGRKGSEEGEGLAFAV